MKRKILSALLALCMCLALLPTIVFADVPNTYHTGDIAAMNSIIANNQPSGMTQAPANGSSVPSDWGGKVYWDYSVSPRRIIEIYLEDKSLTGILDVSGLTVLTHLYCNNNQLTGLNTGGMTSLIWLECNNNQLTGTLDVSSLTKMTYLICAGNQLTGVTLNAGAPYNRIDVSCNNMADNSAVTNKNIDWEDPNYTFYPQYKCITYDANGGIGTMTPGKALDGSPFMLPENGFKNPLGKQFKAWAIGSIDGTLVKAEATHTFTMDTTVYAIWEDIPNTGETEITFDPAGGKWEDGTTALKIINAMVGDEITIVKAPVREGYEFDYWEGSIYRPGERYQVPAGGHRFTAVWNKAAPVPQTGDHMGIYLWTSLLLLSAGGLVLALRLVVRRKKSKQRD